MAIDGANANLGPDSKELERKLEELLRQHSRDIQALQRQIAAVR